MLFKRPAFPERIDSVAFLTIECALARTAFLECMRKSVMTTYSAARAVARTTARIVPVAKEEE
jgi:hypothetical protein